MLVAPVERRQPCPAAYIQIVQQVTQALRRGDLRPGERMPSIRSAAAAAGVHVNTAQRAFRVLVELEVLEVHRGRGIFVRNSLPERSTSELLRKAAEEFVRLAQGGGASLPGVLDLVSEQWATQQGTR